MTIHKEGHKILLYTFLVLAALNILVYVFTTVPAIWYQILLAASVVFFLLILQFFRHPRVTSPKDPKNILAPADGKVVVVETTEEPEFLNEKRVQISIFMSPLNVHVNRNPVSGVLKYFKYHPGKYLVAWHPKSSTDNERTTLVYELENGLLILVRQIAGAMARRIKCYINVGDRVEQGAEFGFIRFGSRLDVFVPESAMLLVKPGDKTIAGKTILAKLNE